MERLARFVCAAWLGAAMACIGGPAAAAPPAAAACPPEAVPLDAEAITAELPKARDRGFLWRITKDGRSSFLYGTIHAARRDWAVPGPTIVEALAASDTLALELDLLDPEIQQRLAAGIAASRAEALPPAVARRLALRKAAECVDAASWQGFAPEFQVASLTMLAVRRDGFDPAYAVELGLARVARSLGKPVASLETPEAQMAALQQPTAAATAAFVDDGLGDLERGTARPLMRRIAQVWEAGDYARLASYAKWCGCLGRPAERAAARRLVDERNPALAAAIDALHAGGQQVFAAVGSLHMVGPTGLPALMKQRGYKVEQGRFLR